MSHSHPENPVADDSDGRISHEPDIESALHRIAWKSSPEYRKYRFYATTINIGLVAFAVFLGVSDSIENHIPFFSGSLNFHWDTQWPYTVWAVIAVAFSSFLRSSFWSEQHAQFNDRTLVADRISLTSAESKLAETGNLDLAGLWALTQRRLDYYHDIATEQAKKSFRNAQAAMALGFLILGISAALSITAKTTVGSVVAGTLGGIGAVMSGYIGRTFIRTQETTADHLRSYFDQPLEFSRILSAERLLALIDENDRANVIIEIVKAIIKVPEA